MKHGPETRPPGKSPAQAPTLDDDSDDDVLVDHTQALALRSRKTSRQKKKLVRKEKRDAEKPQLLSLSPELLLDVLALLRPTDILRFQQTCHASRAFILGHETSLARAVISHRYPVLSRCLPRPVLLRHVDPSCHAALLDPRRQRMLAIHRAPYAHVERHDPAALCSCLTCVLAWNNLCLVVDLAHWTRAALARRQPIPMIPRGQNPPWNARLVEGHAAVVRRALESPLWYALVLQRHLQTTVFGIRRHAGRGKDAEAAFGLTDEDADGETDAFCAREGHPSFEFPIHRDVYYGLATYLPNRIWDAPGGFWKYQPADQHVRDLQWVQEMASSGRAADHGREEGKRDARS